MIGSSVRLVMPDVAVRGYQPPLQEPGLRTGLLRLASNLIPGVGAEVSEDTHDGDVVFLIGDSPWNGYGRLAWRLGGTRWKGSMAQPNSAVPVWSDDFPIGAIASATIAAAEPFKVAIRDLLRSKAIDRHHAELDGAERAEVILAADDHLAAGCVDLGALDVISGGAITTSTLFALLRLPNVEAVARVIEPESLDLSNLNRYPLAMRGDVGRSKVLAVQRFQHKRFQIAGIPVRFDRDTARAIRPLATSVLVGTDDIPSRWRVQEEGPDWIGVGATAHFTVVVSEHGAGQPCVGCLHPEDDDVVAPIATASFVSMWAGH